MQASALQLLVLLAAAAAGSAAAHGLAGTSTDIPTAKSCKKFEGYQGLTEAARPPPYAVSPGYASRGSQCASSCDCHDTRLCKSDGWGRPRCWPAIVPKWKKGRWATVMGGSSLFSTCVKELGYKWEPKKGEKLPGKSSDPAQRACLSSCQCDSTDLCTEEGWCMIAEEVVGQGTPFLT